jgi:5-methylcytosine-specific restriction endonuclease McrA
MTSHDAPDGPAQFRERLLVLRRDRERRKDESGRRPRRGLSSRDRQIVLATTGKKCHICGGAIESSWQADHVLAHSGGGHSGLDNYLPSHSLCNHYRWDYLPEEFQMILKLGVWARTQIEKGTPLGGRIVTGFVAHDKRRASRRKGARPSRS